MLLPVYVHLGLSKMEASAGGLYQPQRGLLSGLLDSPVQFLSATRAAQATSDSSRPIAAPLSSLSMFSLRVRRTACSLSSP